MITLNSQRARWGFTTSEIVMTAAISVVLSAVLIVGAITIQRNFQASARYSRSQAMQARLLDYIALDLRRAITVNTATAGSISMTMPDYFTAAGEPRDPAIRYGRIIYGDVATPVTVQYFKQGANVIRRQGTTDTTIANEVEDFQIAVQDEGQVIEVNVSFVPTFQRSPNNAARDGTKSYIRTLLRNKRQA
jgi:hypothetical protein